MIQLLHPDSLESKYGKESHRLWEWHHKPVCINPLQIPVFSVGGTRFSEVVITQRFSFATTQKVHQPRSQSPLHFNIKNIQQLRSEQSFSSARRLLSAALLEHWLQVCRVKITFIKFYRRILSKIRFHNKNSMKCVVNWILLRIRVYSRNTQLHLQGNLHSPFRYEMDLKPSRNITKLVWCARVCVRVLK